MKWSGLRKVGGARRTSWWLLGTALEKGMLGGKAYCVKMNLPSQPDSVLLHYSREGDRSTAPSRGRFYYLQEDAELDFSSFVSPRFELRPSGLAASPATHWPVSPISEFYIRPTLNVGDTVPWSWRKWEEYSHTYIPLISILGCGRDQLFQLCHCDFPAMMDVTWNCDLK